jgi:hypothetical protein
VERLTGYRQRASQKETCAINKSWQAGRYLPVRIVLPVIVSVGFVPKGTVRNITANQLICCPRPKKCFSAIPPGLQDLTVTAATKPTDEVQNLHAVPEPRRLFFAVTRVSDCMPEQSLLTRGSCLPSAEGDAAGALRPSTSEVSWGGFGL